MRAEIQVPDGYVLVESVDLQSNLNLRFQQGVKSGLSIGERHGRELAAVCFFIALILGVLLGAWLA